MMQMHLISRPAWGSATRTPDKRLSLSASSLGKAQVKGESPPRVHTTMLSKDVLLLSPVIDDKEIIEIPKRWQCEHCHEHYAEFEEVLPLPTPLLAPT